MQKDKFRDGRYRNQGLGSFAAWHASEPELGPTEVVRLRENDQEEIMPGTPWDRRELLKVMSAGAAAGF